jgi:AcrR family transcriptional regulator
MITENVTPFRKLPQQERSRVMVSFIVEAAQQVLEKQGQAGFNTNAIAERAGISIGSLYQYFPNKHAIVAAMARNEIHNTGMAA